jgi:hypothetical protein
MGNGYYEEVYKEETVLETREKKGILEVPVIKKNLYINRSNLEIDRWSVVRTEKQRAMIRSSWRNKPEIEEREREKTRNYTVLCTDDIGKPDLQS